MSNETIIRDAISRSISHHEIVHVTIQGDSKDAVLAIDAVTENTDIDHRMCDYDGVDTMDVWGWTAETPENEHDWRLAIRFAG